MQKIETGTRLALQQTGQGGAIPEEVCPSCYDQLRGQVSQGAKLMAHKKAQEQRRTNLWNNRVLLLKKAREYIKGDFFAEAAIAYEKYLRILELSFKVGNGQLHPEMFEKTGRQTEMTVIASVYWDLLRIYDTNPKYKARQELAARKLALFCPHSPTYRDILRRAKSFQKDAKNRAAVQLFLKNVHQHRPRCFIATAAYQDPTCMEVQVFQSFRDQILSRYWLGRRLIDMYYAVSPALAYFVNRSVILQKFLQAGLTRLANLLRPILRLPSELGS